MHERPGIPKVLIAASTSSKASGACFRGVARYARAHGWHLDTDMMYTGAFPRGWNGDGIIALVAYQPEIVRQIQLTNAPCVAITGPVDDVPFPCISANNGDIGQLAADHFLERAYRNFAWAPFVNDQVNNDLYSGFEERLAEHGCTCQQLPLAHMRGDGYWYDDREKYRRGLIAKLLRLPRPTAIFAANDSVAAGIVNACRDLGIVVPDAFAVIGVGNDETLCETASVPLSSVEPDFEEMGYRAAATLGEIISGNPVSASVLLPPKGVITRISTDIRAVSDSRVGQALSYIAEHYSNSTLSVDGVAGAVGMSRRHLERSFRTATGCTLHDHITKRRMQEASRLLRTHQRAKVSDIAELVGLSRAGSFFRTFRRFFGESPKVHRECATRVAATRLDGLVLKNEELTRELG